MNFKRACYIVFIFILCTIFNMEVKAAPTNALVKEDAKEFSCAYWNDKEAYKLVQDKSGVLYLYYPASTKKDSVIIDDNVSWSGPWGDALKKNPYWFGNAAQYPGIGAYVDGSAVTDVLETCPNVLMVGVDIKKYYISMKDDIDIKIVENAGYKFLTLKKQDNQAHKINSETVESESSSKFNKSCDEISVDDMWINKDTKNSSRASCLYSHDLKDNGGCMVLQLNIDNSGAVSPLVGTKYETMHGNTTAFNDYYIRNKFNGYCPNVYVTSDIKFSELHYSLAFEIPDRNTWQFMKYRDSVGSNLNDSSLDISDYEYDGYQLSFIDMTGSEFSCSDLFDEDGDLVSLLHMLLVMVKIIVPIIIIVLGSLDFATAIFAGDESNMKKAQAKFIKRLVIGVAIFLVPSILKLLLTIGNSVWPIIDADLCGIL